MDKVSKKFLLNELNENCSVTPMLLDALSKNEQQMVALAAAMEKIDPRMSGKVMHKAGTIMLVALMGVFAGAQTWNQVANYGKAKIELLKRFIPDIESIPEHDTIRRFFMIVDSRKLEEVYREWALGFQGELADMEFSVNEDGCHVERRHLAIDGKTICGAADPRKIYQENKGHLTREQAEYAKLHIVSLYNTDAGVSLAQERVNVKENELAAIPKLLEVADLGKGDIVTIDAMGTHAEFAKTITEKGADYIFEVKGNQRKLKGHLVECMEVFREPACKSMYDMAEETLTDHSMITHRTCYVLKLEALMLKLRENWPGMNTIGAIVTTRTGKDGTSNTEEHYFITSLPKDPILIMKHKREHWKVENALHWNLDIIFNEDKGRKMMTSAQNYSLLTKMALAILKNDKRKMAMTDKRLMAGWDDNYMETLVRRFICSF